MMHQMSDFQCLTPSSNKRKLKKSIRYETRHLMHVLRLCEDTVRRSPWSCRKTSAMSWWRKRAAACSRPDTASATPLVRRKPWRSTWTAAPLRTRDKTDGPRSTSQVLCFFLLLSFFFFFLFGLVPATWNASVKPDGYLNNQAALWGRRALTLPIWAPDPGTGSEKPTVHYNVCTVKFKGM